MTNFFDAGSPYLQHPLLTEERTRREVDRLAELGGDVAGRVLDIGCGFGRHSVELARRGADVTGIDPSPAMIAAARDRARETGVVVDFEQTSMQTFTAVGGYDLAICLFTTFGQLPAPTADDSPHVELLQRAEQALRPGGRLVIEAPDRDRAVANLIEDEMLGPTHVTRHFDPLTSTVAERFELEGGQVFDLTYRVFDQDGHRALLESVGFEVELVHEHGLVEPPLTMLTIVARRPG